MKLVIVSGLSGSGKTVALHTLEDSGYYCIDNLPLGMLPELINNMTSTAPLPYDLVAVAIDARSGVDNTDRFDEITRQINHHDLELKVLFLTCDTSRLLKRFSETRRKHPLSRQGVPLADAIQQEKKLLEGPGAVESSRRRCSPTWARLISKPPSCRNIQSLKRTLYLRLPILRSKA